MFSESPRTANHLAPNAVDPHLAILLRGGRAGLRADLAARYFTETGAVAGGQALTDATLIFLEGLAATQAPDKLNLRVADHHGTIYIDTGDPNGQVIKVCDGRWSMAPTAPVRFLRNTKLTGAMPAPSPPAGDVTKLWEFVNVAVEDRPVLLAFLVAALVQCDVPHPVLALFGEQGSAKNDIDTELGRTHRSFARPPLSSGAAGRGLMGGCRFWIVGRCSGQPVGHPAVAVGLVMPRCDRRRMVKRSLYTDADLAVIKFRRCVIINGIDVGAIRPDLAERLAIVELRRIDPPRMRQSEAEMRQRWETALPGIFFGGLLDLAASVHHRLETITVEDSPRMADFCRTLAAVDEILSTNGVRRYMSRANQLSEDSLSVDPFIEQLRSRTLEPAVGQSGSDLLMLLTPVNDDWQRPRDWPKNGRDVSGLLRRHAPALRNLGWVIEDDGARNRRNVLLWTIYPPYKDVVAQRASQPSRLSLTQISENANFDRSQQKVFECRREGWRGSHGGSVLTVRCGAGNLVPPR